MRRVFVPGSRPPGRFLPGAPARHGLCCFVEPCTHLLRGKVADAVAVDELQLHGLFQGGQLLRVAVLADEIDPALRPPPLYLDGDIAAYRRCRSKNGRPCCLPSRQRLDRLPFSSPAPSAFLLPFLISSCKAVAEYAMIEKVKRRSARQDRGHRAIFRLELRSNLKEVPPLATLCSPAGHRMVRPVPYTYHLCTIFSPFCLSPKPLI